MPVNRTNMTIFFTCSTKEINKYKEYYKEIRHSILKLGHKINRDWILESIKVHGSGGVDLTPSEAYDLVLSAILTADIVIVDATVRSMSIGHQISFALSKNKPVLVLRYAGSDGNLDDLFINNDKSSFLTIKKYTEKENLLSIIKDYLDNESSPKTRFNLVMNKNQNKYIEWAAFKYDKSKTDIIQEAIEEKSLRDSQYKQ